MAEPETGALHQNAIADAPLSVTWSSLTGALRTTGVSPEQAHAPALTLAAPPPGQHPRELTRAPKSRADPGLRQWEMVLPRMERRAVEPRKQLSEPEAPAPIAAPQFTVAEARKGSGWIKWAVAGVLAAALSYPFWTRYTAAPPAQASAPGVAMGESGWVTDWASDETGSRRGRQITLYRPSLRLSDYRLEFLGEIDRNALGWVND